jgi:hypothetical protein
VLPNVKDSLGYCDIKNLGVCKIDNKDNKSYAVKYALISNENSDFEKFEGKLDVMSISSFFDVKIWLFLVVLFGCIFVSTIIIPIALISVVSFFLIPFYLKILYDCVNDSKKKKKNYNVLL